MMMGIETPCELQGLYLLLRFFMISQAVPSPTLPILGPVIGHTGVEWLYG